MFSRYTHNHFYLLTIRRVLSFGTLKKDLIIGMFQKKKISIKFQLGMDRNMLDGTQLGEYLEECMLCGLSWKSLLVVVSGC